MHNRFLLSLLLTLPLAAPAFASQPINLNQVVVNAAGNTRQGSSVSGTPVCLRDSLGEPVVGQIYGGPYSVQAGFFNEYFLAAPTPTATPTMSPTPLLSIDDFKGQLIDSRYFYVAPNPTRSVNVNFKFFLKQSAEVEIRIYTPQGSHVLTKSYAHYAQGWNTVVWNASGMANGVYFYIVEAKANGVSEKFGIKKLALIKH